MRRFVIVSSARLSLNVGVDIYAHTVPAKCPAGATATFRLMIWDTQGEIDKRIFTHPYFQGSAAVCIVGDVTSPDALASMNELALISEVEAAGRPCILLSNKVDLLEPGTEPEWPMGFDRKRWPLFLTSAKDDIQVTEAFLHAAKAIIRRGCRASTRRGTPYEPQADLREGHGPETSRGTAATC